MDTARISSLVFDWNRVGCDALSYDPPGPRETTARAFETTAMKAPSRTAIVTERAGVELSYSEVDTLANKISSLITQLLHVEGGDEAEKNADDVQRTDNRSEVVLVALPRSTSLPVALLGVVKTKGCAYWGVDLSQQSPAVVYKNLRVLNCRVVILDDASQRMIFDQSHPQPAGVGVINLSADGTIKSVNKIVDKTFVAGSNFSSPANTMYVEFTSGSTGEPKAVAVPHIACVGFVKNSAKIYSWDHTTRSLLYHSVSFDLHAHDLWGPWAHGGAVVVVDVPISDVNGVWTRGSETRVTHLSMTPFGFQMFTTVHFRRRAAVSKANADAHQVKKEFTDLRVVMLCGEALDIASLHPWLSDTANKCPDIINSYGITETTIVNTFLHIEKGQVGWPSSIGRRLPHTLMLLLDDQLAPVSHGTPGEVYLSGDCLACGYITNTEKTDRSFVPIPTAMQALLAVVCPEMACNLIYKTGDVATYREEFGGFVFGGRVDNEIKSGGFRIHPLEVEQALSKLLCVKEAIVVAAKHPDTRNVLMAFIVVHANQPDSDGNVAPVVTKQAIRQQLRDHVADYKLPTIRFVESGSFPMTASHKVDRVVLSKMGTEILANPTMFMEPAS